MEESQLLKAAAYVELNPVKSGKGKVAWEYSWSSVHAHLLGKDGFGLVETDKLLNIIGDWRPYPLEAQVILLKSSKATNELDDNLETKVL